MNLSWALHRLSAMSGREIGYRIKQQVRAGFEQVLTHDSPAPQAQVRETGRPWVAALPVQLDSAKYRLAGDAILAGELDVFAMRPAQPGFPPEWNRDPKTGRTAPLVFGRTLNYRDEALVGDIKYLWEPSRHAQLVTLAQAWHLSGDVRYARGCRTLLDSWFAQCPYPLGVHWTSSLELALRLVNWAFTWHLLGGERSILFQDADGTAFRERWLASIFRHCQFVAGHLSRYSSANNHLLGELTGLVVATLTWPLWRQSARWLRLAQREMEEQVLIQNAEDGVNREQATWYHHEVADMMLVAGLTARANGYDFSAGYWQRLRAMLEYVASIMDAGGHVPAFGDADDAVIARLDPARDADVYRSALATGAVLFNSPALKQKAGAFDDKSRWLLGDAAAEQFAALDSTAVSLPIRCDFPDAGYYVLGDAFESEREVRIVADAGPLGFLSIAAHGHADALSFTLSAGGKELLIDPGTFAYHTQKRWRDYFRGTAAHNTVRVDRLDQSVSGGNFLWIRHARARLVLVERAEGLERWVGEHDGYRRLDDPVTHRRELLYDCTARSLRVVDELLCRGSHEVELFWHFAESCVVHLKGETARARCGNVQLTMRLPSGLRCELRCGKEDGEPSGWVSRSFDTRAPTTTLVATGVVAGTQHLATELAIEFMN